MSEVDHEDEVNYGDIGMKKMGAFDAEEDSKLLELIAAVPNMNHIPWKRISQQFGGTRSPKQCERRYKNVLQYRQGDGDSRNSGFWKDWEDSKLLEAVGLYRGKGGNDRISWSKVVEHMGNIRSKKQCAKRWDDVFNPSGPLFDHRRSFPDNTPWTENDVKALKDAVLSYHKGSKAAKNVVPDWNHISANVMHYLRSPEQCCKYWNENLKPHIALVKQEQWTHEEDALLAKTFRNYPFPASRAHLKKKYKQKDWIEISKVFNGERSPEQCQRRCKLLNLLHFPEASSEFEVSARKTGAWEGYEDEKLIKIVHDVRESNGNIPWTRVCVDFGGTRSLKQCQERYNNVLRYQDGSGPTRNSGFWKDWEDAKLLEAVGLFRGHGNGGGISWKKVVDHMGNIRTKKQCLKRWDDVFNPSTLLYDRRQPFPDSTPWLEQDIKDLREGVELYISQGMEPNWVAISEESMKCLRSPSQCENYWMCNLKDSEYWTREEDVMLAETFLALKYEDVRLNLAHWEEVSKYLLAQFGVKRSKYDCRKRWDIIHRAAKKRKQNSTMHAPNSPSLENVSTLPKKKIRLRKCTITGNVPDNNNTTPHHGGIEEIEASQVQFC